jgi:glycyl-tRNA synthetase beta subunit
MDAGMEEKLARLRAALQDLKNSGVLAKGYMAEAALLAAVELMEQMVAEIDELKRARENAGKQAGKG